MVQSITFRGTSRNDLIVDDHKALNNVVGDIDTLIRGTNSFKKLYDDPRRAQENNEHNEENVPNVILVRGSDIEDTPDRKVLRTNSGLAGVVLTAWNTHRSLVFQPDDIWIAILAQFSAYLQGNAEELRDRIVDFDGQKQLEVQAEGTIETADFGAMNRQFLDKISEHIVDPTLREWFLPDFSTTTINDQVSAAAMAMCSFQPYFNYVFSLLCGIPEVSIKGSIEDWQALRGKVDRLLEFDNKARDLSTKWVPQLQSIVDNFIDSVAHGSDRNMIFWDSIVSLTNVDENNCVVEPDDVTGWIATFSVFNERGELYADMDKGPWPQVRIEELVHNVATCPAKIEDNGKSYNATLFVGQMAFEALQTSKDNPVPSAIGPISGRDATMLTLKPRNDWGLVISDGFLESPADEEDDLELSFVTRDGTVLVGAVCRVDMYDPNALSDPKPIICNTQNDLKWILPAGIGFLALLVLLWYRKVIFGLPRRGAPSEKSSGFTESNTNTQKELPEAPTANDTLGASASEEC